MDDENMESDDIDDRNRNPDSEDLDLEITKIKGDAIGNTLYSERWVLKTLIKLSEFSEDSWCPSLEQDLCLLWDMTVEEDIVSFLLSNDFLALFYAVVKSTKIVRLIEIMVGIVGNMCCVEAAKCDLTANNSYCQLLISLLSIDDSLSLIQLLRLLNTCLWKLRKPELLTGGTRPNSPALGQDETLEGIECALQHIQVQESYEQKWMTHLSANKDAFLHYTTFFLSSSTNEDLLCCTLELVETLLAMPQVNVAEFVSTNPDFVAALVESLKQLLKSVKVGDSVANNKKLWRCSRVWQNIVGVVATFHIGRQFLASSSNNLLKCLIKMLLIFTTPEALRTQDPDIVMECLFVLETLPEVNVHPATISRLITALYQINVDTTNEASKESCSNAESEEECFEIGEVKSRTEGYCLKLVNACDDLPQVIQSLGHQCLDYLYDIVSKDEQLFKKVYNAILQLRTNGLVQ